MLFENCRIGRGWGREESKGTIKTRHGWNMKLWTQVMPSSFVGSRMLISTVKSYKSHEMLQFLIKERSFAARALRCNIASWGRQISTLPVLKVGRADVTTTRCDWDKRKRVWGIGRQTELEDNKGNWVLIKCPCAGNCLRDMPNFGGNDYVLPDSGAKD